MTSGRPSWITRWLDRPRRPLSDAILPLDKVILLGLLPFAAMVGGVVGLLSGNDVWSQSLLAILIGGVLAVLIVAYLLRPLRPDAGDPQQQEEQVASTPPASVIWWQRVAGWLKSS